jgi:hypothetical protein
MTTRNNCQIQQRHSRAQTKSTSVCFKRFCFNFHHLIVVEPPSVLTENAKKEIDIQLPENIKLIEDENSGKRRK